MSSFTEPRYGVITGAASGLGRAIAVRLARDGWQLALADLNPAGCEETKSLVEKAGGAARVEPLDVRDESQWLALREQLRRDWPHCDLIVNNAGVVASGVVHETPMADWDWLLSINLRGVILGCHTFVPWLIENPRRSYVLNMASIAGLLAPGHMGAYNVAKAGVVSLSETLYVELKQHNVGVTVVCPWFVQTNLLDTGRFVNSREKAGGAMYMRQSRLTPDSVADYAVRRMYRNKLYAVTGFESRQMWLMKRHFPQPYASFAEWVQRRFMGPRS